MLFPRRRLVVVYDDLYAAFAAYLAVGLLDRYAGIVFRVVAAVIAFSLLTAWFEFAGAFALLILLCWYGAVLAVFVLAIFAYALLTLWFNIHAVHSALTAPARTAGGMYDRVMTFFGAPPPPPPQPETLTERVVGWVINAELFARAHIVEIAIIGVALFLYVSRRAKENAQADTRRHVQDIQASMTDEERRAAVMAARQRQQAYVTQASKQDTAKRREKRKEYVQHLEREYGAIVADLNRHAPGREPQRYATDDAALADDIDGDIRGDSTRTHATTTVPAASSPRAPSPAATAPAAMDLIPDVDPLDRAPSSRHTSKSRSPAPAETKVDLEARAAGLRAARERQQALVTQSSRSAQDAQNRARQRERLVRLHREQERASVEAAGATSAPSQFAVTRDATAPPSTAAAELKAAHASFGYLVGRAPQPPTHAAIVNALLSNGSIRLRVNGSDERSYIFLEAALTNGVDGLIEWADENDPAARASAGRRSSTKGLHVYEPLPDDELDATNSPVTRAQRQVRREVGRIPQLDVHFFNEASKTLAQLSLSDVAVVEGAGRDYDVVIGTTQLQQVGLVANATQRTVCIGSDDRYRPYAQCPL